MIVYVCLLVYLLYLSLIKLNRLAYVVLSFLPLFIISAIRSPSVGNDALSYTQLFQLYSNIPWSEVFSQSIEPGFIAFSKLISYISTNGQWFLIASSFLICLLVAKFIYNNSNDIVFSAYLFVSYYFYFYSFSAIRQYIALGFAINAFYYFKEKKIAKSIIFYTLALSFHYTALIYLPVFILSKLKCSQRNITVIALVCLTIIIFFRSAASYIIVEFDRFSYYRDDIDSFTGRGWDINIILYIFFFVIIILGIKILKRDTKFKNTFFKKSIRIDNVYYDIYNYLIFMMISLSLYMVSVSLTMAARANHYYAIFLIIYIPLILSKMSYKYRRIFKVSIIILFFIYCVSMLMRNNYHVVPYYVGF
jgi:hypothetical protein